MANPDVPIDRRSPPLPLTAMTRGGSPVSGSAISTFELVLPPPKLGMHGSAPSRFDRERSSSSGAASSFAASASSHRFFRNRVSMVVVSDTSQLHVLVKAPVVSVPLIGVGRGEPL